MSDTSPSLNVCEGGDEQCQGNLLGLEDLEGIFHDIDTASPSGALDRQVQEEESIHFDSRERCIENHQDGNVSYEEEPPRIPTCSSVLHPVPVSAAGIQDSVTNVPIPGAGLHQAHATEAYGDSSPLSPPFNAVCMSPAQGTSLELERGEEAHVSMIADSVDLPGNIHDPRVVEVVRELVGIIRPHLDEPQNRLHEVTNVFMREQLPLFEALGLRGLHSHLAEIIYISLLQVLHPRDYPRGYNEMVAILNERSVPPHVTAYSEVHPETGSNSGDEDESRNQELGYDSCLFRDNLKRPREEG